MNKRLSKAKLGRTKSHREALMRNQMRSLFTNGSLVTTTPKAKALKQTAESFLSKVEVESLEHTRAMYNMLGSKDLVKKCAEYIKKGENKVSIVKVSFRDGDSAETSKVTLIDFDKLFGKKKVTLESKKTGKKKEVEVKEETGKTQKVNVEKKTEKKFLNIKDKFVNKERAKSRSGL